ncbi:MAG TPA: MaoC family dehydratase [Sporichthyaceae bacterium]
MHAFASLEEVAEAVGHTFGPTEGFMVDQDCIAGFAGATQDNQWIHVDVARAADGPFGTTIAHGFLTLSLIPYFAQQLYSLDFATARINYGLNKVRFPSIVPVGSALHGSATVLDLTRQQTGSLLTMRYVVQVAGAAKPACIAETLTFLPR